MMVYFRVSTVMIAPVPALMKEILGSFLGASNLRLEIFGRRMISCCLLR